ncbi:hypothetical protein [Sporosarcina koreensis]|uniref:hypothetical protein n=1 Tax=Sporosarcina koreensis TaxID=334735 RepID=UPI000756FE33|nr:hypothetical protein [Sporosarcina koreensis]
MQTLQDQLIEKGPSQVARREIDRKITRTRGKREEQFTARDWEEIMGVNRDTYRRGPGGAFRRR